MLVAGTVVARAAALSGCFGNLDVDEDVARNEHLLGDRNQALAHLMRAEGTLQVGADDAVAVYARACATLVDAEALAVMGATLALGGVNPVTGERVVTAAVARDVVSVMATCGVYDGSGRWMRSVGIPAESSVSGAIVLSAPGALGAAVFSPPLDGQGTSVRSVEIIRGPGCEDGSHGHSLVQLAARTRRLQSTALWIARTRCRRYVRYLRYGVFHRPRPAPHGVARCRG